MDCDPGHDDTIALISARAVGSSLETLAVTTVAGNQPVDKNTTNALNVLDIMGRRDIAVAKSAGRPLIKPVALISEIYGESGLGGPKLPSIPSRQAVAMSALDVIINKTMVSDIPVTVVTIGPLTNIATTLIREPRIVEHTESITLMGGGIFGSWTPTARFNTRIDTEVTKRIFESGITINVLDSDVTHQVLTDDHMIEHFEGISNPVAQFVVELLQSFKKTYKAHFNMDGGLVHDACAILYLLQPELFIVVPANTDIEHQSSLAYGTMAVDLNHVTGKPANAYSTTAVDVKEVRNSIDHRLHTHE